MKKIDEAEDLRDDVPVVVLGVDDPLSESVPACMITPITDSVNATS